jgi:integrase/recombinase XerD
MLEHCFVRPSGIARLRGGPLGPSRDDLATTVHHHRYALDSIRGYLRTSDQCGRWLSQQGSAIAEMDDTLVKRDVGGLQQPPAGRWPNAAEGLSHLRRFFRQHAILPPRPASPPPTAADQWLIRYALYLEQVCGAAASTRTRYLRIAKRFLTTGFGAGPGAGSALQAQDIATFVRQEAATNHGGGRKMPGVAVRALLRFLVFCGELRPGLEAAVPPPRQWTHATRPQRLTAEEVERVRATHTGGTPKARRNHAILMRLARLGLRAHEVASLRLEDLDWREGRVMIRPGKTRHARVLPLSSDVGHAVAAYLRHGRPTTIHRLVVLHGRAPVAPFADAAAIRRIATRALRRAGVTGHPRLGAHTFRHTAASQMVNRGASCKDVADVLGHQSLQTTGIYAKLDLAALTAVALPWSGEA